MSSQLHKSRNSYKSADAAFDAEHGCWALMQLLWKLKVLNYNSNNEAFIHHREIVVMWRDLWLDMIEHGGLTK
jgi:hypothetical protein